MRADGAISDIIRMPPSSEGENNTLTYSAVGAWLRFLLLSDLSIFLLLKRDAACMEERVSYVDYVLIANS
jgi:hypothetical protein